MKAGGSGARGSLGKGWIVGGQGVGAWVATRLPAPATSPAASLLLQLPLPYPPRVPPQESLEHVVLFNYPHLLVGTFLVSFIRFWYAFCTYHSFQ